MHLSFSRYLKPEFGGKAIDKVVTSCAAMNDRRPVNVAFNQNRRMQRRGPVIHVMPDEVALRVVCHNSVVGGIIGSNGSVISKLRRDTGTKIHIESPGNESEHRIVFIVGSATINKTILLTDRVGDISGGEQKDWVTCEVSAAQAALIRVLERSWVVIADNDEEAYCGILANQSQIGALMGKGGKNVKSMRRESGAMIRVLPQPTCGTNNDELIQITGGILSVKKALVMVSGCLQDSPPLNGYPPPLCSKAYDSSTDGNSEDPHSEFFPNLRSLLPPLSSDNPSEAVSSRYLSSVDAEGNSYHDLKATERKVVFKLMCTNVAAGGIIGKNGTVIRALQNETGAAISFKAPLKFGERIVTISATENLESRYSPAQNALILVFARTVEIDEKRRFHDGTTVKALLLVPSQFANGFITNNTEEITAIGANVHVSVGDQIIENESILEIKGEYKQVEKALSHIAFKLRDTLLPKEFLDEVRARVSNPYEVGGPSHIFNLQPSQVDCFHNNGGLIKQQNATRGDSLSISDGELDSNMVRTGIDLMKSIDHLMHTEVFKDEEQELKGTKQLQLTNSLDIFSFPLSKGISLKNQTLELAIEEDALVTLCGRDGAGIDNLQQITGAKVDVRNRTGSETMIVISGSCEQTRAAMSLIVSILAHQS